MASCMDVPVEKEMDGLKAVSKVVIEGSQDSREMTENDLKVIIEKVIAVLRIV
jgi:hypothetical protein